jgi:hypothetical protein
MKTGKINVLYENDLKAIVEAYNRNKTTDVVKDFSKHIKSEVLLALGVPSDVVTTYASPSNNKFNTISSLLERHGVSIMKTQPMDVSYGENVERIQEICKLFLNEENLTNLNSMVVYTIDEKVKEEHENRGIVFNFSRVKRKICIDYIMLKSALKLTNNEMLYTRLETEFPALKAVKQFSLDVFKMANRMPRDKEVSSAFLKDNLVLLDSQLDIIDFQAQFKNTKTKPMNQF